MTFATLTVNCCFPAKPRTDFLKCSFSYSGALLWNNLPEEVHTANSLDVFKRSVHSWFADQYSHTANQNFYLSSIVILIFLKPCINKVFIHSFIHSISWLLELLWILLSHLLIVTFLPLLTLSHWNIVGIHKLLSFFYKCMYNMGPNYIKEMFLFHQNDHDLRGFLKLKQHTYHSRYMHRSYHYMQVKIMEQFT